MAGIMGATMDAMVMRSAMDVTVAMAAAIAAAVTATVALPDATGATVVMAATVAMQDIVTDVMDVIAAMAVMLRFNPIPGPGPVQEVPIIKPLWRSD